MISCIKSSTALGLLAVATFANSQPAPSSFYTPEYFANWGLKFTYAADAWALGYTGAGIKLGIADVRAQLSHPEFAGRTYWPDPVPPFPAPGYPDFPDHGTHVMGVAAAARNGVGMVGVAFDASLASIVSVGRPGYPSSTNWAQELVDASVSVMNGSFGPRAAPGFDSPYYDSFSDVGFQFYNGGGLLDDAESVRTLSAADVVMVFSAGNNRDAQPTASRNVAGYGLVPLITKANTALGYTDDPSAAIYRVYSDDADDQNPNTWAANQLPFDEVKGFDFSSLAGSLIAVTAVDINESTNVVTLASFSNECGLAANWCVAAPGVSIYSTVPMNTYASDGWSGTSMAAPFVAGSAAVLRQAFPYMTARQIIEVLLTTATEIRHSDSMSIRQFGHGFINIGRAVRGPFQFGHPSLVDGQAPIFPEIFAVDTQGYDSVWSNNISGSGGFSKAGAGILTLTGTNTYMGDTTITGGMLRVNGSIASSDLTVTLGGALQGTGTVGDTLMRGILSPGNSVGTLTVQGNLNLESSSTYLYEIDADQNGDLVVVTGTATIADGAVFELSAQDGVYLDRLYPMLRAGTLNGTFENLHTNYTFLDLDFISSAGALGMVVERNQTPMAAFAQTNNQRAVAKAIDAQSPGDEPYNDVLLNDNPSQLAGWYQNWSGEIYSANQAALIYNSRLLAQVVNWRLEDSWLDSAQAARLQQVGQKNQDTTVWAQAYGNRDKFSADANAQQATANSGGFILGIDHKLSPNLILGGGFSASVTNTSVAASSADTSGYHLLAYAKYQSSHLRLNGGVVQSWYTANVNRTLPLDDLGNASATVASHSTQLFADLSSPVTIYKQEGQHTTLSPFGQVSQIWLNTSNFGETGAEAGLNGQATNASTGFGTLGARLGHQWQSDQTNWQASLSVGWQRAWGDLAPSTTLAFATGPDFTVSSAAIARDSAVIEIGIGASLGQSSRFNLVYSATLANQSNSQMLQAQLQMSF